MSINLITVFFVIFLLFMISLSGSETRPIDAALAESEFEGHSDLWESSNNSTGPVKAVDFLRRFGYLTHGSPDSSSETLYTEESIQEAVSEMQRFAGLVPTGRLDASTQELMKSPRCGVPDLMNSRNTSRAKRFVIGAGGWNKRRITYRIEKWFSNPETENEVVKGMEKAMGIWSPYSRLSFKNLNSSNDAQVDILISFGRGYHGDRYPFDGPGGILAHAYFPYEFDGLGGDIHFDSDEDWASGGEKRFKFLDVAVHEVGHSLGLAHSPIRDSVMFPYYQGTTEGDPRLAYDDILALYQLYIQRPVGDGDDEIEEDRISGDKGESSTRPSIPSTSPSSSTTQNPISTSESWSEKPSVKEGTPLTTQPTSTSGSNGPPNLCKDSFDSLAFLRNELFVFSGHYFWRLKEMGAEAEGYPTLISRLFPPLAQLKQIDAALERDSDGKMVFFSGNQYWVFDGTEVVEESPRPLTDFGLPPSLEKLDGAFIWGKNRLTYFFSGNEYWRFNETSGRMDEGYPAHISRWGGVPDSIDSVLRWRDDKTYFFKDGIFWRFDDYNVAVEEEGLNTGSYWFNCES